MKIFLLFLFFLIAAGCDIRPSEERPENYNAETIEAGVVVHGYDSIGYIENTNNFPVRVKCVWVFRGESTSWIRIFKPSEKVGYDISNQNGYYILDMNGVEIGHIRPMPNGKR